jgi:putative ABC transport system permease protein
VAPGFFRTLGIRLIEGREFVDADRTAPAAVVNEAAAKRWWPGQSALGKRLRFGPRSEWMTVVGVAGDVKTAYGDVQIYNLLQPQNMESDTTLVARTSADPAALAGALKGQVWSIDPRVPVTEITTLTQAMTESMSRPRFNLVLLSSFAAVGLLLAAIGIYGVISYSVGQRTQEIGLRMALGALPRDIRRAVVGEAVLLSGIGLAIGVAGALAVTRVMRSMLFEVSPSDPASFGVTVAVLAATAVAAAWVPARRAMRVDPMVALRAE